MWQLPGVVVVLVVVVVVCEPPAGIDVVLVELSDVVVDGGVVGVAGFVVTVVLLDVVVDDVELCASVIGTASARPMHSAPAARRAFMTFLPGPRAGPNL